MQKTAKIVAIVLAGIVALLALALFLLSTLDLNRARPWIADKVSAATERSFSIEGDLSVSWERPVRQDGSRGWLPWPTVHAEDLRLGNPDWATTGPDMARIKRVDVSLNPLALLGKTVQIESLSLTEPHVALEQDKEGRNNWTFKEEEEEDSAWGLEVRNLSIDRGAVRYVDPVKSADMTARINTFDDGGAEWKVSGKFNDEKISGGGKTGALLALQEKGVRYPFDAEVKVGESTVTAKGTLTNPANPSAVDLELKILGASMADLFPLSGVLLPETPKFSTEGRVVGTLDPDNLHLRYEKFKGEVGSSDLSGTLEFIQKEPRPLLRGEVVSNHLNFKDLAPIIGVGDSEKKEKDDEVKQPPDKVLPVAPFKTERWDKMDAEVKFTGKEIVHGEALPLDNLHVGVKLDNARLSLAPLDFGIAGGKLTIEIHVDGQADPAKARLKVAARKLKLSKMFPKVEEMQASLGQMHGDAELTAAGNSIADLMASANGEVKSTISEGTVSKFILEAAGLNVGSVVLTKLFGDRQVQLNCMAVDFGVKDGLMQSRVFVVDTEDATIWVNGDINFDSEEIDLEIRPDSKGVRLISLRSPLYVGGTFKEPEVGVDKGIVALKAGAAVALGTIASPFAALLALINPGPEQESPCAALLKKANEKPEAPPPGKSAPAENNKR